MTTVKEGCVSVERKKAQIEIGVGDFIRFKVEVDGCTVLNSTGEVKVVHERFYTVRTLEGQDETWDRVREDKHGWSITDDDLYEIITEQEVLNIRGTESDKAAWSDQNKR